MCQTKVKSEEEQQSDPIERIDILHERIKKRISEDTPPDMVNTSPEKGGRDIEIKFKNLQRRRDSISII